MRTKGLHYYWAAIKVLYRGYNIWNNKQLPKVMYCDNNQLNIKLNWMYIWLSFCLRYAFICNTPLQNGWSIGDSNLRSKEKKWSSGKCFCKYISKLVCWMYMLDLERAINFLFTHEVIVQGNVFHEWVVYRVFIKICRTFIFTKHGRRIRSWYT